jgi:hypothetical protein
MFNGSVNAYIFGLKNCDPTILIGLTAGVLSIETPFR